MKNITRRQFLKTTTASTAALSLGGCNWKYADNLNTPNKRPNVLFIFSDQQHWQGVGFEDKFFDTPNIDQFAKSSVVFDNSFCTTPQCSPSRSSILTGLYPSKTGVMGNMHATGGDSLQMRTIAPILQQSGYYTGYFGKWHLGKEKIASAGWDQEWRINGATHLNEKGDNRVTEKAARFLAENSNSRKPFALFLSYINPHDIYLYKGHNTSPDVDEIPLPNSWYTETLEDKPAVHKQFMTEDQGRVIWGKKKHYWQLYRDCYRSKVKLYDNHVGKVLRELKKQGLWDDTIIIVTSDHGDMDTNHRLIYKGPFMYEHMVRVPLMFRVPGQFGGIKPCRISDLDVVNVDLFPTLLDFCGIDAIQCDGISLKPTLTGTAGQKKRDFVIGQYYSKQHWVNPIRMLRTPEFKYNKYLHKGQELYDLKNDPDELVNLAENPKYAIIKNKLAAMLDDWLKTNNDPFYSLTPVELKESFMHLKP